ncbi:MAG: class I SAM-dependent methyltransferase [Gammaproteobacteria bacterium]
MKDSKKINSKIYESYLRSPYSSLKLSTYFNVYDQLLSQYRDKSIVFLEIGILDGGSLFMWRDFFGPQARIIGVDLNPEAKKWEKEGFEIFIGDQSSTEFWKKTLNSIGKLDIVLDDGGHTYEQQIMTTESVIPFINDGGVIIVEDCHTSYMKKFGFRKLSFINYAKKLIDNINKRYVEFDNKTSEIRVWSIQFFESIVALHINFYATSIPSEVIFNQDKEVKAEDFRYDSYPIFIDKLEKLSQNKRFKIIKVFIRLFRKLLLNIYHLKIYLRLRKYLKSKSIF